MPRPVYPSDEARKKQRPHVRIHLSCRSHPRYGHVFDKLESRAIVWGLWLLGVQYHAGRTNNQVSLGRGDITWLTNETRIGRAMAKLEPVLAQIGYKFWRADGDRLVVEIRNLQRKQGLDSAVRGATPRSSAPSEVRSPKTEDRSSLRAESAEPEAGSAPPHGSDRTDTRVSGERGESPKPEEAAPQDPVTPEDLSTLRRQRAARWRLRPSGQHLDLGHVQSLAELLTPEEVDAALAEYEADRGKRGDAEARQRRVSAALADQASKRSVPR